MALVLADRVQETTTTTGTGSVTLGGAVLGYQSFAVVGNGNTTFYTIADQGGANWEVGIGTYTSSGTTLSRDTVLASSNSGSLVSFTAGTKTVFVTYPAEKSVNTNAAGNIQLDFTNATLTSRNSFQTSTTNGSTGIYALPNGTSTASSWQATNNANPTNASKILIATNGSTDVQLVSGINGTGTYLPLSFYVNGAQAYQMTTTGALVIGTGTTNYGSSGQLLQSNGNAAPSWTTPSYASPDQAYFLSFMMG
jgi:hypothetical protein